MNVLTAYRALKETAKQYGVPLHALMDEMRYAIAVGMASSDPAAQAFWQTVPRKKNAPSPVELVAYLSELLERPGTFPTNHIPL